MKNKKYVRMSHNFGAAYSYGEWRRTMRQDKEGYIDMPPCLSFFQLPVNGDVLVWGSPEVGKSGIVHSLCEALMEQGIPILYWDMDDALLTTLTSKLDPTLFRSIKGLNWNVVCNTLRQLQELDQLVLVVSGARNLRDDPEFDITLQSLYNMLATCKPQGLCVVRVDRRSSVFDVGYEVQHQSNRRRDGQVEYSTVQIRRTIREEVAKCDMLLTSTKEISKGFLWYSKQLREDRSLQPVSTFHTPCGTSVAGCWELMRKIDYTENENTLWNVL
jgi:hypothetical protein